MHESFIKFLFSVKPCSKNIKDDTFTEPALIMEVLSNIGGLC